MHRLRELLTRLRASPRALGALAVVAVLVAAAALDVPGRLGALAPSDTPTATPSTPTPAATTAPRALLAPTDGDNAQLDRCTPGSAVLAQCGPAPELGRGTWVNSPRLGLDDLRGSVVLVDFFSGSCLACQRDLKYVKAWQASYADAGLRVVGVHSPRFEFEQSAAQLRRTLDDLSITFPVMEDDASATLASYRSDQVPSAYLIDRSGTVRAITLGEGGPFRIEGQIRKLLVEDRSDITLPEPVRVTDVQETVPGTTTQIDLVDARGARYDQETDTVTQDGTRFRLPPTQPDGTFSFGGPWTFEGRTAVPGAGAQTRVGFRATTAFQLVGGRGVLTITRSDGTERRIAVDGVPNLYALYASDTFGAETLTVRYEGDLQVYAFSFG